MGWASRTDAGRKIGQSRRLETLVVLCSFCGAPARKGTPPLRRLKGRAYAHVECMTEDVKRRLRAAEE